MAKQLKLQFSVVFGLMVFGAACPAISADQSDFELLQSLGKRIAETAIDTVDGEQKENRSSRRVSAALGNWIQANKSLSKEQTGLSLLGSHNQRYRLENMRLKNSRSMESVRRSQQSMQRKNYASQRRLRETQWKLNRQMSNSRYKHQRNLWKHSDAQVRNRFQNQFQRRKFATLKRKYGTSGLASPLSGTSRLRLRTNATNALKESFSSQMARRRVIAAGSGAGVGLTALGNMQTAHKYRQILKHSFSRYRAPVKQHYRVHQRSGMTVINTNRLKMRKIQIQRETSRRHHGMQRENWRYKR